MARSDAYDRFMKSTVIGFDQWHDGIGYDLDAFRAMSADEQAEVVSSLKTRGSRDWRDIEVFELVHALATPPKPKKKVPINAPAKKVPLKVKGAADTWSPPPQRDDEGPSGANDTTDAGEALRESLNAEKVETRLHAAVALRDLGEMPDFTTFLAEQLAHVGSYNSLSYALDLVEKTSPRIRDALLRGARDRPDVAVHFAAKLCHLAGKAKTDFDWDMRPFFLRFGEGSPAAERAKAYKELLKMIGAKDPGK